MIYKQTIDILISIIIVFIIGMIAVMPNMQKQKSKIVIEGNTSVNENESISFDLCDLNITPIVNSSVVVVFKDQNGNVTNKSVVTDGNGIGNLSLNGLNAGNYFVNIIFNGEDRYINSTLFTNLAINEVAEIQNAASASFSTSSSSSNNYGPDVGSGGITR